MYALVKFGQMRRAAGGVSTPDADVNAWIAQVVANGGTVTQTRATIVYNLVSGLKTDSLWAKLDRLWLFAAANTPSALTDLRGLTLATEVSSPTFTVDYGYQGNASSSYIDTNFPPNTGVTFLQDSAHIGAWDLTSRTTAATKALVGVEGASTNRIEPRTTSGSGTQFSVNAVSQATVANADAQGAYIVSRTGSTTTDVYKNGSAIITGATNASATRTNIDFYVLANNSGGTAAGFSDDQCAAFWLGGGLNSTEVGNLHSRLATYLGAIHATADTDVNSWIVSVFANGGSITDARASSVYNLVTGLKSDGIWSKLDRLWLFAAENPGAALTDLKARALATLTNAPTFTVDIGFTAAATKFINTGFDPTAGGLNYVLDFASAAVWALDNVQSPSATALGVAGIALELWVRWTDDKAYWRINDGTLKSPASTNASGFWHATRTANNAAALYRNGSSFHSTGDTSTSIGSSATIKLLGDGSGTWSPNRMAAAIFGSGMNSTEATALYNRLRTYMIAVGVTTDDADVNNWVDSTVNNGGTVSNTRRTLVYNLITGLKSDGVWSKLDRLWLFAAENAGSALTDLVAGALATATNSPSFTTDRGYTGNGSSAYIDTNFNASTASGNYGRDSACFFAWNNTSGTDGGGLAGYTSGSGQVNTRIFPEYTSPTNLFWDINSTNNSGISWDGRTGLYLLNRSSSSSQLVEVNGNSVDSNSGASAALPNFNFVALQGAGGSGFSSRQASCFGFGSSLSSGERTAVYNRLRTYMTAVGVP